MGGEEHHVTDSADEQAATPKAMTEANLATYAENEVEELEWLAESDACEECKENEEASPIKAGDEWPNGDVPCHPR